MDNEYQCKFHAVLCSSFAHVATLGAPRLWREVHVYEAQSDEIKALLLVFFPVGIKSLRPHAKRVFFFKSTGCSLLLSPPSPLPPPLSLLLTASSHLAVSPVSLLLHRKLLVHALTRFVSYLHSHSGVAFSTKVLHVQLLGGLVTTSAHGRAAAEAWPTGFSR